MRTTLFALTACVLITIQMYNYQVVANNIVISPCAPGLNSRLLNMIYLSQILGDAGHNVTFLISSLVRPDISIDHPNVTVVEYFIPKEREVKTFNSKELLSQVQFEKPANLLNYMENYDFYLRYTMLPMCRSLFEDKMLLDSLKV